jgi:hypothetical protein
MALRLLKRMFLGRDAAPKSTYLPGSTPTTSEYYEGMTKWYREYRQDSLTRNCVNLLAFFATCKGYETVLELTDPVTVSRDAAQTQLQQYGSVKDRVDQLNKAVNLDWILFIAVIKAKVYGKVGFEIQPKFEDGWPQQLIPLLSEQLKPDIEDDWAHSGFTYRGHKGFYHPGEVLYFPNLSIEGDLEGLSDVEPIAGSAHTRRRILTEDLPEVAHTLWAPISIHEVDTTGLSEAEARKAIDDHVAQIKPGKSIATNQKIKVTVVEAKVDFTSLVTALEYCDTDIIGNFNVPRFLLSREKQVNRATAQIEFQAFIEGPIADIQRYYTRQIERQWYDPITRKALDLDEDDALPVRVKHVWNIVAFHELYDLADAVSKLWGPGGRGPLAGRLKKVWNLMHWDPEELEED